MGHERRAVVDLELGQGRLGPPPLPGVSAVRGGRGFLEFAADQMRQACQGWALQFLMNQDCLLSRHASAQASRRHWEFLPKACVAAGKQGL